MRPGPLRRALRVVLATLALLVLPPTAYVAWAWSTDNFGTLQPGRIYRSWQMSPRTLTRTLRDRRIKTVLNLRGVNPDRAWYRDERAATTAAGATQVDVSLSSCEWISRAQLRAVVRVFDTCEYPLLIHCEWGSERTGLASAVAALLRPGGALDDARRQFSIGYLYAGLGDGKVMAEHIDRYEGWLRDRGGSHTPARFRLWVNEVYRPGAPSREQWPYDPKPLVVVTRPAPGAVAKTRGVGALPR